MSKIFPCLWFDGNAEEAAEFYVSLFANSKISKTTRYGQAASVVSDQKPGAVMTVEFELASQKIMGLNGGPHFKFTPALSFFVWCESESEIETLWKKLAPGGEIRMELNKYPWAQKYGWTADRFGTNWQLMLTTQKQSYKLAPALLFVEQLFGRGDEAIRFYTSTFPNSKIETIARDESGRIVMHCIFSLDGTPLVLMEGQGKHGFTFSPAFSFVVSCRTQAEIDDYWSKLSNVPAAEQCGWLQDKFGLSWQIVPAMMAEWMTNPEKSERVMKALLKMKKLDIEALARASE